MNKHYIASLVFLFLIYACTQSKQKTTIAFGSCSHEFDTAQMWNDVIKHNPSAWIWMGDNIYGDTEDMNIMKSKYDMQKRRSSYQKMIQKMDIYGIWDDHDYGVNDGGREYPRKDESKELMLDFLDVPTDAKVRHRKGAYQSYIVEKNGITIKIILLDTRYFRDTLQVNIDAPPLYHPNAKGTILGNLQWKWFENELTNSEADIHLIGSSYQLIPNDHGYEKWGNFPNERKRFFELIANSKPARPIILSGDRHIAEFSKTVLDGLNYPLHEFTSSGLTHTWQSEHPEVNQYRIGELIIKRNFGVIEIEQRRKTLLVNLKICGANNEILQEYDDIFQN